MKKSIFTFLLIFVAANVYAQTSVDLQKIYDSEKAFERAAAEKGINQSFVEFSAPDGICFFPGYPVNCREYFKSQPASSAAIFWNPTFVDVSSNGALGYTTGNSVFRPKGKNDTEVFYGQYLCIWQRQPDGSYKAVLDTGISHAKPDKLETDWKSPADSGKELNAGKSSAADNVNSFFETATRGGLSRAYKTFAAADVRALRENQFPITGKNNLLAETKKVKANIAFAKRSVFFGAADMAYITNSYALTKKDNTTEKGNFVQIWKLRGGKWLLVMDVFVPTAGN